MSHAMGEIVSENKMVFFTEIKLFSFQFAAPVVDISHGPAVPGVQPEGDPAPVQHVDCLREAAGQ